MSNAPPTPANAGPPKPSPRHVFFATRSGDWRVHAAYLECLIQTIGLLATRGIRSTFRILSGGNILLAQNRLLGEFLASGCTDFFTIDSDLAWEPESALRLLSYDVDVVACDYTRRERFADAKFPCPPQCVPGPPKPDLFRNAETGEVMRDPATGLYWVPLVKGGFQRIRRAALERMVEVYCPVDQPPGSNGNLRLRDGTLMLFDSTITPDGDLADDNATFCHRWRDIGGDLWLDGGGHFEHIGPASYYHPPLNDLSGVTALAALKPQVAPPGVDPAAAAPPPPPTPEAPAVAPAP